MAPATPARGRAGPSVNLFSIHMTTRITQKRLFRGSQTLEVVDAELKIRMLSPFRKEAVSSIPLSVLNPEPILSTATVSFVSRASGQALVKLAIGKPDQRTFNEFVNTLKARILAASDPVASTTDQAPPFHGNVQDAPPELADDNQPIRARIRQAVKPAELEVAIDMLKKHLEDEHFGAFIACLEDLKQDPADETRLEEVARRFDGLGIGQGAVLTYAPYLGFLLSDNPFGD